MATHCSSDSGQQSRPPQHQSNNDLAPSTPSISTPLKKQSSCASLCQSYHEAEQQFQIYVNPHSVSSIATPKFSANNNSNRDPASNCPSSPSTPSSQHVFANLSHSFEQISLGDSATPICSPASPSHYSSSQQHYPIPIDISPGASDILNTNVQKMQTPSTSTSSSRHDHTTTTAPLTPNDLAIQFSTGLQNELDAMHTSHAPHTPQNDNNTNDQPKCIEMEFTQGTTDLKNDLIISIPDDGFLQENMEYITHLLYTQPTLTLQELVICISHLLQNGRELADLNLVENALQRYNADSGDFQPFLYVDHELQYTRNLVATDNKHWTLLLLCWNPHSQSPIHNHPQCECYVRVLQNSLIEYRYNHPDGNNSNTISPNTTSSSDPNCATIAGPDICSKAVMTSTQQRSQFSNEQQLQCISQAECLAGMVTFMNDDLGLHKLQNRTDQHAITLHLYFPPYSSCKIYLNECRVATISNICYHSIRGKLNYFNGLFGDVKAAPSLAAAVQHTASSTSSGDNCASNTALSSTINEEGECGGNGKCTCPPSCPCPCDRQ